MANFEFFIAKRISKNTDRSGLSAAFMRLAVFALALSVVVIILSVGVLNGFKKIVRDKMSLFSGHIVILKQELDYSFERSPINYSPELINDISSYKGVVNIHPFALKTGLIKTKTDILGVILKGVDTSFSWDIFKENLVRGRILNLKKDKISKEVIISEKIANMLNLDTGKYLYMYFFSNPPRMRKYKITGIYSTGVPEFDKSYIIVDIRDVERLNDWDYENNRQITGYEIIVDNFKNLTPVYNEIYNKYGFRFDPGGNKLDILTITDLYPNIFNWLSLLDVNALVLIIIVFTIAAVNIITALLILILDRARMIGILKALGASNWSIRKIFIFNGLQILLKSMIWANAIALLMIFLENKFQIIKLNPDAYYASYVYIKISAWEIILLNLGVIALTFLVLIIPSLVVSKISPSKVIKFN